MPAPKKTTSRHFRSSEATNKRLAKLQKILEKDDTAIIEDAISHLLYSLERDQPVWFTPPKKPQGGTDAA